MGRIRIELIPSLNVAIVKGGAEENLTNIAAKETDTTAINISTKCIQLFFIK